MIYKQTEYSTIQRHSPNAMKFQPPPTSILCLSDFDLQIIHRQHHGAVLPIHVRVRGIVQRHVESTEQVRQRELELRVRQAVIG